jgi:hypothetical protein
MTKVFKKITQYPDIWKVFRSEHNTKPIIIRYRSGMAGAIGHPEYPYQIGIAVPLLNPTKDGLTTEEEAKILSEIEDALNLTLSENQEAAEVMAITTNGMREFVFYAPKWEPEYYESKVKSIDGRSHQLQFMIQSDPEWNTFKSLVPKDLIP